MFVVGYLDDIVSYKKEGSAKLPSLNSLEVVTSKKLKLNLSN